MLDTTDLTTAVERLADRLRAAPQSRLARGAATEGLELARELARRAQLAENPGEIPLIMPDAGMFAVADQVTVAGMDLAEALRTASFGGAEATESARDARRAAELAEAVELVRAAAERAGL
ncbi:hypothetical protein [Streptomyces clavuligerus]|uniref:Uncharacterized protein n=1 Tax=Streptomyces clavuligerus TaxID=1901 RepID=B5GZP9_STRCL|nr:hypothetical protein [Streptomyces clavuligerus]ANW19860.1 hypothetical protein BB341_17350 [Streptomyces clavuligerus]AXU14476.1 hypothetical protein D1794_18120 [Streptomyces clavuligerus]EDY51795.1 hypothetical protein SSCG_04866 [Streptomyces clavuligerus]EFG07276.1 Hypothetical protein SCLAV_2203 [Streptomyces clavuligerus]MBY6304487.1 hypothetical protein [Streptomyces clavuligerus]